MFKRITEVMAVLTVISSSVFGAGNADVAIKFSGPSGQGEMITYAPKNGATNIVCATDGTVTIPGVLTVGTIVTNGVIAGNLAMGGTLDVTDVATFTAESVHNAGIDADYITTDAAKGIDTKTAGTLMVGAATANKIEVSVTGVETEVQGTLQVVEAATFDSSVGVTGTLTASGATSLSNTTIRTGSTLTVGGNLGLSTAVTNAGTGYTNIFRFYNGVLTNYTAVGTMP